MSTRPITTTLFPSLSKTALRFLVRGLGMQAEMTFGRMTRAMLEVLVVKFLFDFPSTFLLVESHGIDISLIPQSSPQLE